jgi:molybdate/tungstate transport system substrate-binding protein
MNENPEVKVQMEAAGSVECARKVSELGKPCDIILTSDYKVINKLLIPEFTTWYIKFASNELCLAYTEKSRFHKEVNRNNWFEILLNESVAFGRSDPKLDPCGYRTLFTFQLAEKFYGIEGLSDDLSTKDKRYIRPKEVDLLALLETASIDYVFIYRSVALQHGLKYLKLPDEINLKEPGLSEWYASASVTIAGKDKDEEILIVGEPMEYGISVIENAPNRKDAMDFVDFLLNEEDGIKIIEANGQSSLIPSSTQYPDMIPDRLKKYVLKPKENER